MKLNQEIKDWENKHPTWIPDQVRDDELDMPKIDLIKTYEAKAVEDGIYKKWEDSGYFNPDNLPGERSDNFVISMPPPNVTGVLHLGHAFENTLMDIQIRYQRMKGKRALIVPGTDHAAVATQARVEDE